jgi:hypothetical protein
MARAIGKTTFDITRRQSKPVHEGPIFWTADEITGTAIASPRVAGKATVTGTGAGHSEGFFQQGPGYTITATYIKPGDDTAAWDAGDTLEVVGWLTLTGFSTLSANHRMGFIVGQFDDGTTGAGSPFLNTNSNRKVGIWADSAGLLRVVSANVSALTETTTGVTAVSGTRFKFYLKFIAGTSVAVSINDGATTTVSTNIAPYVNRAMIGNGTTTSGTKVTAAQACRWRLAVA